jgi:hypothetical protein
MAVVGWFACALLFLQLFVASEAISANIASHRQFAIGATFAVLPGLVAFMGVWTVMFDAALQARSSVGLSAKHKGILNPLVTRVQFTVL